MAFFMLHLAFLTILWLAVAVKFCIDLKVSDKLEKSILLPTHFEFAFLLILMAFTGKNFFSVMILLLLVLSIVTLIRETHYHNLWCIPDKYWV